MANVKNGSQVKYEIVKEIATLSKNGSEKVMLAVVKWGNHGAKYDLRRWTKLDDGTLRAGKGITLSADEVNAFEKIAPVKELKTTAQKSATAVKKTGEKEVVNANAKLTSERVVKAKTSSSKTMEDKLMEIIGSMSTKELAEILIKLNLV